ncbi:unnamed protein product [Penicillium salamii]|nr:unnamed protein product [Penicillium salamii]
MHAHPLHHWSPNLMTFHSNIPYIHHTSIIHPSYIHHACSAIASLAAHTPHCLPSRLRLLVIVVVMVVFALSSSVLSSCLCSFVFVVFALLSLLCLILSCCLCLFVFALLSLLACLRLRLNRLRFHRLCSLVFVFIVFVFIVFVFIVFVFIVFVFIVFVFVFIVFVFIVFARSSLLCLCSLSFLFSCLCLLVSAHWSLSPTPSPPPLLPLPQLPTRRETVSSTRVSAVRASQGGCSSKRRFDIGAHSDRRPEAVCSSGDNSIFQISTLLQLPTLGDTPSTSHYPREGKRSPTSRVSAVRASQGGCSCKRRFDIGAQFDRRPETVCPCGSNLLLHRLRPFSAPRPTATPSSTLHLVQASTLPTCPLAQTSSSLALLPIFFLCPAFFCICERDRDRQRLAATLTTFN